ncbi:MAG: Ig domain-containing protein, partial [Candidatus Ornithomonoglobus sp.]
EYNEAKNGRFDYKSNTGAPGSLGIKGSMDTRGFMEIKLADGESMQISGGVVVKLQGSVEYTQYFVPAVYAVYSLGGEIGGELTWELVNTSAIDPKINFSGKISAGLTPGVAIGAGARAIISGEVGLEGTLAAEYSFPAKELREALRAELSATFYGAVYVLNHPMKISKPFAKLELYPDFGYAEVMSVDEPDLYTINREYLNTMSVMADEPDTVKANLYPYSDVQTARLSDGRAVRVWTDDDTDRNAMDRTALYYSIQSGGVWSEAQQIDNDGTADFDFALSASGSKAAIVWQIAEYNLADDASLEDTAAAVELKYAELDGSEWNTPISVTAGNSGYEYSPSLYYDGSAGYIVWIENENNAALPDFDEIESVYSASVRNGSVSAKTAEYENMKLIYGTAAGAGGMTACIADKDGDYTTEDGILYVDGIECHVSDESVSGLHYADGGFCFSENGVLRKSDGRSSYAGEVYPGAANTEPRLLANSATGEKAAVYELQNGFVSNLYASYYKNGAWTKPVKITDYNEKIRSWDAWLDDDGSIVLSAVLADISVEGEELSQSVRLVQLTAEPIENIAALYISSDNAIERGKTAEFNIGIENDSRAEELTVTITGDRSGELYTGTVTAAEVIAVSVPIPEDFEKQTITAYVTGAENESDLSDNSASEVFGAADLSVELRGSAVFRTGTVSAVAANISCEDAENAVVTLKAEDGSVIGSESIGTLGAGAKKTVKFTLDEGLYTFEGEYDSALITAEITSDTEDSAEYNNSTYYIIRPQSAQSVQLDTSSIGLEPGEEYMPKISVYPAEVTDAPIYMTSSDESVAAVDENGRITAVSEGSAVITYMTPGAVMSAKLTVYVHEKGTPEITSVVYTDESGEDYISGSVDIAVDTSACLAEGEKAQLITAAYAEDGTLLSVNASAVTASESSSVSVWINGKKPKRVKVMLWSSLSGMKPVSYTAESEL